MTFETLISVSDFHALLAAGQPVLILDCTFDLAASDAAREAFLTGHIPGARYADLKEVLSGPVDGVSGRHPLPSPVAFSAWLRSQGLVQGQQVVAYDANAGAGAARAWWMLRWLGHAPVAVLDGGVAAWKAAGLPLESGTSRTVVAGDFAAGDSLVSAPVSADDVLSNIATQGAQVLDARDASRFAGGPDALDPVSGHIPGARNRWFRDNLDAEGLMRPSADLAAEFSALLGGKPAILSCGSGVTACHNALAMAHAGLPPASLYPGSWSEWISDPTRPVET